MNFVYPEFLFALAAISVPIIVHLFNFRRFKKVYFPDIRFLKDVEMQTRSRNQLKNLLILLFRILAIACLVLAFAQPVIRSSSTPTAAARSAVVYIDNSFSMNAEAESGILLDEAKLKAIEIGKAYASGTVLRLLTNDFLPDHFRDLSFDEFKNEVAAVQPSPTVRTFDEVASRTSGMATGQQGTLLYYVSDLQRHSALPTKPVTDSLLTIYSVPVSSNASENLYIDSCWFNSPTRLPLQADELIVRVRNSGTTTIENLSVKLLCNGIQRSVATVTLSGESFELVKLGFTNPEKGLQFMEVSITDYPITFDDRYYLSYDLAGSIHVLNVTGEQPSRSIERFFDEQKEFELVNVPAKGMDYSLLGTTELLILNQVESFSSGLIQEVMRFVQDGGHVLVIPAERPELNTTNELLLALSAAQLNAADSTQLKIERVNLQSEVYRNVFTEWEDRIDLPTVKRRFTTSTRNTVLAETLLTLADGEPYLVSFSKEKGRAYLIASPLTDEWTNFHRHALFVPTLYNIGLNSSVNRISAEVIGSGNMIAVDSKLNSSELLHLTRLNSEETFVPERVARADRFGIMVHDQIHKAGHFVLQTENGDTLQPVSFNYDRTESQMSFLEPSEFQEAVQTIANAEVSTIDAGVASITGQIKELHHGKELWRLFLVLALLCLLIETVLTRIL